MMDEITVLEREKHFELQFIETNDMRHITHVIYDNTRLINACKLTIAMYINNEKDLISSLENITNVTNMEDSEVVIFIDEMEENKADEMVKIIKNYDDNIRIFIGNNSGKLYNSVNAFNLLFHNSKGDYYMFIDRKVILTKETVKNMIYALDSDYAVGAVAPNTENIELYIKNGINAGNAKIQRQWEEKMTLPMQFTMYKREVIDRVGDQDYLFSYGLSKRIVDCGYKLFLLKDTCVYECNKDSNDITAIQMELEEEICNNRFNVSLKEDIIKVRNDLINMFDINKDALSIKVLGVDVKCGQDLLVIRNKLGRHNNFDINISAFTTDAKYYKWLENIADLVMCDREEFLLESLKHQSYDYIIIGKPINQFNEPFKILNNILYILSNGGQLVFCFENTYDISALLKSIGMMNKCSNISMDVHIDEIINKIYCNGDFDVTVQRAGIEYEKKIKEIALNIAGLIGMNDEMLINKLLTNQYCVKVKKNRKHIAD